MTDTVAEKLILTLPPIRIDQPLYMALMQHATSVDRAPSYVVREAIRAFLEVHGRIVPEQETAVHQNGALPCDACKRD